MREGGGGSMFFLGISTSNLCMSQAFLWAACALKNYHHHLVASIPMKKNRENHAIKEGGPPNLLQKMCKFWANLCMSLSSWSWRQNLRVLPFAIRRKFSSGWQQWLTRPPTSVHTYDDGTSKTATHTRYIGRSYIELHDFSHLAFSFFKALVEFLFSKLNVENLAQCYSFILYYSFEFEIID